MGEEIVLLKVPCSTVPVFCLPLEFTYNVSQNSGRETGFVSFGNKRADLATVPFNSVMIV